MKPQVNALKLNVSKKTITKLDDSQLAGINGGASFSCNLTVQISVFKTPNAGGGTQN
ncbi:class I lanthipeptide [Chitinophaga nivalis]|uniref:Class I lanthipeptide n=1 Tax=Chitinophaga nivalis TaxID=2991709 RepID=A0ABT3INL5_9BACT|nr:class I lanthipeptide [Chitinophaga nivalis]MCW3464748.1 class I lanthipeptide [Chitinophaga nivalis]MCW3485561.1 class I lanthipeptide [Chitinophaga nivalis]